eukprot:TRINITY_DN3384_c0_g1_i1.p1 TRINITY_DN3384_c0_g1~~TRINITY_DN3384_c0_g1_i1.p1  ORF type:complete len:110 (-),score=8.55 TRINITY_DN3384_c0_g1_i1:59-388(-)
MSAMLMPGSGRVFLPEKRKTRMLRNRQPKGAVEKKKVRQTQQDLNAVNGAAEEELELFICDGCGLNASGVLFRCLDCSQYVLCPACETKSGVEHFQGSHLFKKERHAGV